MRLLVMGDTHIPNRAKTISPHIIDFIDDFSPHAILFTGDACEPGVLMFLEKLAPLHAVLGNMDKIDLPKMLNFDFGKKILLIHGHQFGRGNYEELTRYASGYDILICGHTHHQEHFKKNGVLIINPGSVTGAETNGIKPPSTFTTIIIKAGVKIQEYVVKEDGIQKQRSKVRN